MTTDITSDTFSPVSILFEATETNLFHRPYSENAPKFSKKFNHDLILTNVGKMNIGKTNVDKTNIGESNVRKNHVGKKRNGKDFVSKQRTKKGLK